MSTNILVVDASSKTRKNTIRTLKEAGVSSSVEAADADGAVNLFKQGNFDLVLMDWKLLSQGGQNPAQEIRSQNGEVPIIATATPGETTKAQQTKDRAVTGYLTKPFTADTLRETLSKYISA